MIIPIRDIEIARNIIPLMKKVEMPFGVEDYMSYIQDKLPDERCLLLVNIDDNNNIDSFIFVEVFISITILEAMVDLAYYNPKDKKVGKEMQFFVEKWAKMLGCKMITTLAEEDKVEAYKKKYGFNKTLVLLMKDI